MDNPIHDIAIIGGGPAGLAAATFALGVHLDVVVVSPDFGGRVNTAFEVSEVQAENIIWGSDLVRQFSQYVESHQLKRYSDIAQRIERAASGRFRIGLTQGQTSIMAKVAVIATGAKPQRLYIPGEMEYWGRGVSFSAVSHAPLFRGRDVAVIGYGERALVAVLKLAALAHRVYWLPTASSPKPSLRQQQIEEHPRVAFWHGARVKRILGERYANQLELTVSGEVRNLKVDGVFIEMGLSPNSDLVRDLVQLDEASGHILVNQHNATSVAGIYAAGDVTDVYAEQVPVAIGEGYKAAMSAWEYLVQM
jgi:thioredoxin reductase